MLGGRAEGSRVLLEHLPLFLLSQALVRSREERRGNLEGEEILEEKEESVLEEEEVL